MNLSIDINLFKQVISNSTTLSVLAVFMQSTWAYLYISHATVSGSWSERLSYNYNSTISSQCASGKNHRSMDMLKFFAAR